MKKRNKVIDRPKKRAIRAPAVLCEAYDYPKPVPFSRGMRIEIPGAVLLFISGTASVNERGETVHEGDLEAQAGRTFRNIKALLESEGADWHKVARTTIYLRSMDDYDRFNRVRAEFLADEKVTPLPASTCVEARLCRDNLLVEIEAIAVLSHRKRGHGRRRFRASR